MLSQKVTDPGKTEEPAPIVFHPKMDGPIRICVDYRKLNAGTKRESYPIPRVDECTDSLEKTAMLFAIIAKSAHW